MARISIDKNKCKGCLLCVTACPKNLISTAKNLNPKGVHPARFKENPECLGCAMCAVICPDCCIEVWK